MHVVGAGTYLALEKSRVLPYPGNNQVGGLSFFRRSYIFCFFCSCFLFFLSFSAGRFRVNANFFESSREEAVLCIILSFRR